MTTITTAGDCGCGGASTVALSGAPRSAAGERTRYFPRQLVGAPDLTQDQLYFREKHRRHNRMLHGWGIVCGVRVRAGTAPGTVVVEPGYLLGPYGDEISVDEEVVVDLTSQDVNGDAASGCAPPDPWCAPIATAWPSGRRRHLVIAFAEYECRPVRAPSGCDCGCDDSCEYSRIRDSYRLRVLDELPSTYSDSQDAPSWRITMSCGTRERDAAGAPVQTDCGCPSCSPCPAEPWVVLADLVMSGSTVTSIDCDAHRRYTASSRDFYYVCGDGERVSPQVGQGVTVGQLGDALLGKLRPDIVSALVASGATADSLLDQPAMHLDAEIAGNSVLGKAISVMTIRDVIDRGREDFVTDLKGELTGAAAQARIHKAGLIWDQAHAVEGVVEGG